MKRTPGRNDTHDAALAKCLERVEGTRSYRLIVLQQRAVEIGQE